MIALITDFGVEDAVGAAEGVEEATGVADAGTLSTVNFTSCTHCTLQFLPVNNKRKETSSVKQMPAASSVIGFTKVIDKNNRVERKIFTPFLCTAPITNSPFRLRRLHCGGLQVPW